MPAVSGHRPAAQPLPLPLEGKHQRVAPQFGNVFAMQGLNQFVNIVGKMQQNSMIDLAVTDVGGMVIPRTGMEWKERGVDMGIETFIREIFGTIGIVFIGAWMAMLSMPVANWLQKINAKSRQAAGIPFIDWKKNHIHSESLEMLGNQFAETLATAQGQTLPELKTRFYDDVLRRVQSDAVTVAPTLITEVEADVIKAADKRLPSQQVAQGLLTPAQRQQLVSLIATSEDTTKAAMKPVVDFAVGEHSYLTQVVHVWTDPSKNKAIRQKELSVLLGEMRVFWRQYIQQIGLKEHQHLLNNGTITPDFIQQLSQRLVGSPTAGKPSLLRRLFPSIKQGVLPYALNRRNLLVAVPMVLGIGFSVAIAFINNWLTQRRHNGKVFFPGLGGPDGESLATATTAMNANAQQFAKPNFAQAATPSPTYTSAQAKGLSQPPSSAQGQGGLA